MNRKVRFLTFASPRGLPSKTRGTYRGHDMSTYQNLPAPSPEQGLNRYMQEIRKFPLLEPEEEYMLAKRWADSVMQTLTNDQRIAQLMIVRAHSNLGPAHVKQVTEQIQKYNVGGLCFFQGGPVK